MRFSAGQEMVCATCIGGTAQRPRGGAGKVRGRQLGRLAQRWVAIVFEIHFSKKRVMFRGVALIVAQVVAFICQKLIVPELLLSVA